MLPVAKSFSDKLTSCNLKFTHTEPVEGRKERIYIAFDGDHGNKLPLYFFFDEDGTTVDIKMFSVVKVPSDKLMDMLVLVNELNAQYRWVKFYLDSDNEVTVSGDAVLDVDSAGEELYELMHRFLRITDDIYPRLMKVTWS